MMAVKPFMGGQATCSKAGDPLDDGGTGGMLEGGAADGRAAEDVGGSWPIIGH